MQGRHRDGATATPLYIAALRGHTEVVKLLVDNSADVNRSCTDDGATPHYIAAQNGHTEVVKLLLENKADMNASPCRWCHTSVYCHSAWIYRNTGSETLARQQS